MSAKSKFTVVDLFSGAGGMSFGFHAHPSFKLIAAADAELGKPTSGAGKLQCNSTYALNIGIDPVSVDLSTVAPGNLRKTLGLKAREKVHVLSACPPCTGFSRTNPENHIRDDERNGLVAKSADFAIALGVDILVMENARELVTGNFRQHYTSLKRKLEQSGYTVSGEAHMLTQFGLPQIRERALVIATKRGLEHRTLTQLWEGWFVRNEVLTVKHALKGVEDDMNAQDCVPSFASDVVRARLKAIPKDGGSWIELNKRRDRDRLMTPAMKRIVEHGRIGSHPDVYGRMAWDKPAPTIKRECSHIGNGRYAHPEENRLCTVREMATLQGFPKSFLFNGSATSNLYRHIGDAVPPSISYQIAHLAKWILTGKKPKVKDLVLPETNITVKDLRKKSGHARSQTTGVSDRAATA